MQSRAPSAGDKKRLVVLAFALLVCFASLILRFYDLQIIEGEKWTEAAIAQHQTVVIEPFRRGAFYSNTAIKKGHPEGEQPFVADVQKFHLYIDPDSIPPEKKGKIAQGLMGLLSIPPGEEASIRQEFARKSRSRKIATWLDRSHKERIEAWWKGVAKEEKIAKNALFFLPDYKRSYPFGPLLGSVLHTVQEERDPKTQQSIPTGGLEMVLNRYLQGKWGKRRIVRSPSHPLDIGTVLEEPENGADVYLTVNHYLQAVAEAELAKGIRAANARGGWAVLMDPYTGEIWALAQSPSFDPTRYADYFNDPSLQEATKVKAVTDPFEPASIFKPITAAIALQAAQEWKASGKGHLFSPRDKIPTANGWFPGRSTPLKDGRTHPFLNLDLAIQKSSNVYMGRIVHKVIDAMGEEWYRSALTERFGFGKKTAIELPAESPGLVPTPGKLHPNGKLEWSAPTPYSLAIGHNILINSIQIVRAYAVFANGGFLVQPHIVKKVVRKKGDKAEVFIDNSRLGLQSRVLSPDIARTILRAMKFVTKEGGTSKRADIPGYTEAGKSGTAEKIVNGVYSKDHHISSFIGIAPTHRPAFVLLVSLDDPEKKWIPGVGKQQHGGVSAAPIFREIGLKTLQYLGIAPDDPYGYPPGDPRRQSDKADWSKEVAELKTLYQQWNSAP